MATYIKKLLDKDSNELIPYTTFNAVLDNDDVTVTLEEVLDDTATSISQATMTATELADLKTRLGIS